MMTLLSQKAKDDLQVVNNICDNLSSIIVFKNIKNRVATDHFDSTRVENTTDSIPEKVKPLPPKITIKTTFTSKLRSRINLLITFVSKKIKIFFKH